MTCSWFFFSTHMHIVSPELIPHLSEDINQWVVPHYWKGGLLHPQGSKFVSSLLQLDLSCRLCLKYTYEFTQTHLSSKVFEPTDQKHSVGYKWITSKCSWQTSDKAGAYIISAFKTSQIFITFWPAILFSFKTHLFASSYADILLLFSFIFSLF